jgi:GDPmannose 4,6-dehydratase
MTRTLVVGAGGQDGSILFERRSKGGAVVGIDVAGVRTAGAPGLELPAAVDLQDEAQLAQVCARFPPDEVYYLAARHHSAEEHPEEATELRECTKVHLLGFINVLEALRRHAPGCRVFYASSSHTFGQPTTPAQNESTPYDPRNPYAVTKVAGAHTCRLYRERYGMHVSVGILYNHESPFRGPRFASQRIAHGARRAARDPAFRLKLASLSAVVDWGYAPDFVDAMERIVAHPRPDDYVVATGEPHTVCDFVETAFAFVGLDWRAHVEETQDIGAPSHGTLVGDASKLRRQTGWAPTVSFEKMVQILVAAAGRE